MLSLQLSGQAKLLDREYEGATFLSERRELFSKPQSVTSQKPCMFGNTAVTLQNLAQFREMWCFQRATRLLETLNDRRSLRDTFLFKAVT
jgi:hypothetical protein